MNPENLLLAVIIFCAYMSGIMVQTKVLEDDFAEFKSVYSGELNAKCEQEKLDIKNNCEEKIYKPMINKTVLDHELAHATKALDYNFTVKEIYICENHGATTTFYPMGEYEGCVMVQIAPETPSREDLDNIQRCFTLDWNRKKGEKE